MLGFTPRGERERRIFERMAAPEQADIPLIEQAALIEAALELRQQADGEIDPALGHLAAQIDARVANGIKRDARRLARQSFDKRG